MKISHTANPTPAPKSPIAPGETISIMVDSVELGQPPLAERPGFIRILVDRPAGPLLPPNATLEQILAKIGVEELLP